MSLIGFQRADGSWTAASFPSLLSIAADLAAQEPKLKAVVKSAKQLQTTFCKPKSKKESKKKSDVAASAPAPTKASEDPNALLATSLALALLELSAKLASLKREWSLIATKARRFLQQANKGGAATVIVQCVSKLGLAL